LLIYLFIEILNYYQTNQCEFNVAPRAMMVTITFLFISLEKSGRQAAYQKSFYLRHPFSLLPLLVTSLRLVFVVKLLPFFAQQHPIK